ncbi:hypothetical protein ABPG72_008348 [Tetrahymena utriculariae]
MVKPLTDFERGVIVGMKIAGFPIKQIMNSLQEVDIQSSERTIKRVYEQFIKNNKTSTQHAGNSGRKPTLTKDSIEKLKDSVRNNPYQSRRDLTKNPEANPQGVSGQTIMKSLQDNGFDLVTIKKKILISEMNKEKRVLWSKSLLRSMKSSFKETIFTDETILIFQNNKKSQMWQEKGKNQSSTIAIERWPKQCMVWGAIHYSGALQLQIVEGHINQNKYFDILKDFFEQNEQDFKYFQQDNAPSHNGKKVYDYLRNKHITLFEWASQSPDANPIEHVWNVLKQKLNKIIHEIDNFDKFKEKAIQIFMNDKDIIKTIKKSIENIPKVLQQIISNKGDIVS